MGREYVGIDFHRRRSVVVRLSASGERLSVVRVDNSPAALAAAVTPAGEGAEVVIEATYGWYWAVDVLQELGATVHLANPNALNWVSAGSRTTSSTPPIWPTCCVSVGCRRHGSPRRVAPAA
jgi:hypothetical protein